MILQILLQMITILQANTFLSFKGNLNANLLKPIDVMEIGSNFTHPLYQIHWTHGVAFSLLKLGPKFNHMTQQVQVFMVNSGPTYFFNDFHRIDIQAGLYSITDTKRPYQYQGFGYNVQWSYHFPMASHLVFGPTINYRSAYTVRKTPGVAYVGEPKVDKRWNYAWISIGLDFSVSF